jgi:NADH:ubiquinone oxidoreductase subunit E
MKLTGQKEQLFTADIRQKLDKWVAKYPSGQSQSAVIPSLHICGQVNTYEQQDGHVSTKKVRQVGFQETDIVNISKSITK